MPDVPMLTATPAKRHRRQEMNETLVEVGKTIPNALTPAGATSSQGAKVLNDQVTTFTYFSNLLPSQLHCSAKSKLRSDVIKQIRDLFVLKQMGLFNQQEYQEKKETLLKDF